MKGRKADYFIGVDWCCREPHCHIEREVAEAYSLPMFVLKEGDIIDPKEWGELEEAKVLEKVVAEGEA